jgi:hypothetical protein
MKKPIEECFAMDLPDGEFPDGIWATAGRHGNEYGVYLGAFDEVQMFVKESSITEVIARLKANGASHLAAIVEGVSDGVRALRTGRQKLVRDLAGKRLTRG